MADQNKTNVILLSKLLHIANTNSVEIFRCLTIPTKKCNGILEKLAFEIYIHVFFKKGLFCVYFTPAVFLTIIVGSNI